MTSMYIPHSPSLVRTVNSPMSEGRGVKFNWRFFIRPQLELSYGRIWSFEYFEFPERYIPTPYIALHLQQVTYPLSIQTTKVFPPPRVLLLHSHCTNIPLQCFVLFLVFTSIHQRTENRLSEVETKYRVTIRFEVTFCWLRAELCRQRNRHIKVNKNLSTLLLQWFLNFYPSFH